MFVVFYYINGYLAATAAASQNPFRHLFWYNFLFYVLAMFVCNLNILKMLKVLPCLVESRRLLVEDLMVFVVAVIDFVPLVE